MHLRQCLALYTAPTQHRVPGSSSCSVAGLLLAPVEALLSQGELQKVHPSACAVKAIPCGISCDLKGFGKIIRVSL